MIGIQPGRSRPSAPPPGGALLAQFGAGRSIAGTLVLMMLLGLLSMANTMPAFAAPVNEITARWAENTPAQVAPGGLVTAEWRVNVNDDANAASNAPVDNVTITLTATNGKFAGLPDICKTTGVTPPSSISADGKTMVCNLGTQNMGTAVAIQTPITSDGATGDELSVSGTIGGATASPPAIPIVGKFGMDIKWSDSGNWTLDDGSAIHMDYEWTLNLLKGSPAGPNSVSYTVTMDSNLGGTIISEGCGAFTGDTRAGHPWSGGGHPTDQTAPFVGSCTFTPTATPNVFTMTLTGIDYSQAQVPTKDSAGSNLPTDRVAVASGRIQVSIPKPNQGVTVGLTSSAPTYTSADGTATATDEASNNTTRKVWTTVGGWGSAWVPPYSGFSAASYTDTFRAPTGTEIWNRQASQLHSGQPASTVIQLCTALDTADVTLSSTPIQSYLFPQPNAQNDEQNRELANNPFAISPYGPVNGLTYYYYVGNDPRVTAGSASFDPQAFTADCNTDAANWTTTRPADLSTVKAIRTEYAAGSLASTEAFFIHTPVIINDDTAPGTDIWQTSSYKVGAGGWTTDAAFLTATPGATYTNTTNSRDIMRVVSVAPHMEKSVDRVSVKPGEPAVYTINYAANGDASAPPTVDNFVVTDTLPIGMTFVAGSASPAPVVTTNGSGQQILTWTFDGVTTNVLHSLTYQAVAGADAEPGQTLTNSVTGSVAGITSSAATASVTVSTNGTTTIGKTADEAFIPNVNGDGVGAGSWTVTLKSFDPTPQSFTDTIDILPYNGDGRGTSFSGSYALTEVIAVDGSTVYYTTADPATLNDDPAEASNGAAGNVTGNTVGWTTTKPANPTAVRVIGPALAPGATQAFTVAIQTTGAKGGDVLVNRAQARAEHTELVMRTSAPISVANYYSASLKKYVRDAAGVWHDANTVEDYPTFRHGEKVPYRIVVTNTGQGTLNNVVVSDDKYPAEGGFTIASLAPGAEQTHEFTVTLGDDVASTFVNTASAVADRPKDSNVPPTINTDRAGVEVANYTTVKTSDPAPGSTVVPGQKVTYTVTVAQSGSAPAAATFTDDLTKVLDDAEYNGDAVASIGSVNVAGSGLAWNGTVPVGEKATITYSVTVKAPAAGDQQLTNVVTSPGCVPVDGQFPDCTTNHVGGAYTVSKTSNPVSGSTVKAGDKITYTVHVKQTGKGALTDVTVTDDLSKVLDDAAYNEDATASAGTATFDSKTKTLIWSGDLPVGADITITYSVTVAPLGTGDGKIANVVTPTTPGGTCDEAIGCKTNKLVSALSVVKSVDPKSGTTVSAGNKLTYTLTFKNTGTGAIDADYTDLLSGVLDDAAVTAQPVASDKSLTASKESDGAFTVRGTLAAGATVTVSYAVTVNPDGSRGDDVLNNFVFKTGGKPAANCVTADPLCTTNPVKTPSAPLANTGGLAYTGANVTGFALLALFALLAGGAILAFRRRAKG